MSQAPKGGIKEVVGYCVMGLFSLCLLFYTGMANLRLLQSLYPDPQFVGFGMLSLEGGVIVWFIMYFLSCSKWHQGVTTFALMLDALFSSAGFLYEMATHDGVTLPVNTPILYVIVASVLFNVSAGFVYKMVPSGQRIELPPVHVGEIIEGVKKNVSRGKSQLVLKEGEAAREQEENT